MSYWNLIFHYGVERFARDFENAGGAGLITPDLIPDEAGEWIEASDRHGLDRIFLVSPDSTEDRLKVVADNARGFVYAAARMGVTGERSTIDASPKELVARTRKAGAKKRVRRHRRVHRGTGGSCRIVCGRCHRRLGSGAYHA